MTQRFHTHYDTKPQERRPPDLSSALDDGAPIRHPIRIPSAIAHLSQY
ncbi:MAG: hypothetical protein IGR92_08475 [Leptolyngbyaceae cyanobacterium T60_A2020_046]|nr:hypothetical protein [Leptolyngbyaceae cyanobacterium T60_A2020_046]